MSRYAAPITDLDDAALAELYDLGPGRHLQANFVSSVDGSATRDGLSGGLSSAQDQRLLVTLRELADVVLVGAGTARAERYTAIRPARQRQIRRRSRGMAAAPRLAIVSNSARLDPGTALFDADPPTIVITHAAGANRHRELLQARAEVRVHGEHAVDLGGALDSLADDGMNRALCEGGPHLFGTLLAARCVDQLCLTLSPLLVGSDAGCIVATDADLDLDVSLEGMLSEGSMLFLRYRVRPTSRISRR